jgi:uncharacterized membrane protein
MAHPAWVRKVFSERDLDAIAAAIARVERRAAAEVRVHLEERVAGGDALARAETMFHRLGMHKTRRRNGVLVYLALADRKLAIVGDVGVHTRVGPAYWERVRDLMVGHLRAQHAPREAVVDALGELGRMLTEHFPRAPGEGGGELSNEVSAE